MRALNLWVDFGGGQALVPWRVSRFDDNIWGVQQILLDWADGRVKLVQLGHVNVVFEWLAVEKLCQFVVCPAKSICIWIVLVAPGRTVSHLH